MKSIVSTYMSSNKSAKQQPAPIHHSKLPVQNFRKHVVHYTNHKTTVPKVTDASSNENKQQQQLTSDSQKNWRSSVPVAVQNLLYMYSVIHDLKDQIQHSVENAEEEWQRILYGYSNPSSFILTDSEDSLLEFTFECKPEMISSLKKLKDCMDNMIPIENECLNVLEDVEDSVALSIKKTAWYKVHAKDLRSYLGLIRQEIHKQPLNHGTTTTLTLPPFPTTTLRPQQHHEQFHSNKAEYVLQQGAFSLDQRSQRLQKACQILNDMKKDENHSLHVIRQCLKQMTSTRHSSTATSSNDELDILIAKIQTMLGEHAQILNQIRSFV